MAEGKDGEETDGTAHAGRPDGSGLRPEHDGLPAVESPPLSLTDPEPELDCEPRIDPKPEPEIISAAEANASEHRPEPKPAAEARVQAGLAARLAAALALPHSLPMPSWPRFRLSRIHLKPRQRRQFALTATAAFAATFGAIIGALLAGSAITPPADDASRAAIGQLTRQVTALKVELAAKKAAAEKAAGRLAEAEARKASQAAVESRQPPPDVTGSIPPVAEPTPIPPPRPVEQITAAASRPPVVRGWTLRLARNGLFLVEGRGDIYQVVPGAPLPGVGPVRAIRRQDGRWVVVTPKGLIVSLRDRRHFE